MITEKNDNGKMITSKNDSGMMLPAFNAKKFLETRSFLYNFVQSICVCTPATIILTHPSLPSTTALSTPSWSLFYGPFYTFLTPSSPSCPSAHSNMAPFTTSCPSTMALFAPFTPFHFYICFDCC